MEEELVDRELFAEVRRTNFPPILTGFVDAV